MLDEPQTSNLKLQTLLKDQSCEEMYSTHQLRYITHLIIIPAHSLHQLLLADSHNFCLSSIEQRTVIHSDNISAYNLIFGITIAFINSRFHRTVNFFQRNFFLQYCCELS